LQRYGVTESGARKPLMLESHYAVTGLYFHDGDACDIASGLRAAARCELEITVINQAYLSAE
jgi:glucose-1-phosphate thymidylyltransferase